jgi:hypothetical protein
MISHRIPGEVLYILVELSGHPKFVRTHCRFARPIQLGKEKIPDSGENIRRTVT